ncbi:UDP-glucose:undecaprenyl-phosphate glucose-1-phosphate transferase [Roseovarius litorisediminis]|uniref:UDP-glucose:undecaprenyl-phosphate glucose-1-phosphate transferase n=1 Tax=Roseovarius litorisediminis TaxID=1312363 RepID=A0A1Y5R7X1_9RHOB|nr:sugar transferase [Roseovarius litorisediminis]SLN11187.1 UDP-glucose:undecaprenyl-phosphate glucose-1-phosphate transferase [Roseovarius litorisediminis]
MTPTKRLVDIILALILAAVLAPVVAVISLAILISDGHPVFYRSERMKTPEKPFNLWKFRTMRAVPDDHGVSAAYKSRRITRLGAWLRRHRLDELPQLFNILRGDMSFVGPRPPLRCYVDMYPALYSRVLQNRPGVTGLATLVYHRTEEKLLENCHSASETEEVYVRRCIPMKARLDLIWADNQSLCYDLQLICLTATRLFTSNFR